MSKVFIVRFHVIQFTRYSVVHRRSFCVRSELLYVSTAYSVCQELFSNFLKNFLSCGCPPANAFIRQLLYISRLTRICQYLFTSFHKFLFVPPLFCHRTSDSLHILAPFSCFVNRFFKIFLVSKHLLISFTRGCVIKIRLSFSRGQKRSC